MRTKFKLKVFNASIMSEEKSKLTPDLDEGMDVQMDGSKTWPEGLLWVIQKCTNIKKGQAISVLLVYFGS